MTLTTRPLEEGELAGFEGILQTSFSVKGSWGTWFERIGRDNLRGAFDGTRQVGGLGFYRMGQYFGGKRVDLWGLAGVGVAPEARGSGVAASLCKSVLTEAREAGALLAGLYASTATLYRKVGFEQAGTRLIFGARFADLPRGDHELACRSLDPDEHPLLHPIYEARARAWTGHLDRTEAIWQRIVRPYAGQAHIYAVGEPIEGYVVLTQEPLDGKGFQVALRDLVWSTPASARRLCALLSDLRSLGEELTWHGCGADPLVSLLPEQTQWIERHERWMLRVLDVAGALEARGYPAIDADVHLAIRDKLFADNDGNWVLEVRGGQPTVTEGGRGDLSLDIRALSAMYSGFATPHTLRAAGLLDGDASALASLFAGPEPWCCDHY